MMSALDWFVFGMLIGAGVSVLVLIHRTFR